MPKTDLRSDQAQMQLSKERARTKQLQTQLAQALRQLDEAREAKVPVKVKPAKRRRRKRGDIIRYGFGDTHGNKYHRSTFAAILRDLQLLKPDEVMLGGDMVNCGGFLAEHHTPGYVAESDDTYEEDLLVGNQLLDQIQEASGNARIEYLSGNHETRVERWIMTQRVRDKRDAEFLYRQLSPDYMLRLKQRGIAYYRRSEFYDGCSIPGWIKRGKIYFTHEISAAKNAAAVAVAEAAANVVYFHSHRQDSSLRHFPSVGLVAAYCPGCVCERQPLWKHTRPSGWNHGAFVQFISPSGAFLHINIPITDGQSLLQPLLDRYS